MNENDKNNKKHIENNKASSPCWYCKYNGGYGAYPEQTDCKGICACDWVENGKPIAGWTATKGNRYSWWDRDGIRHVEYSYVISECPKYELGFPYMTLNEVLNMIAETLPVSYQYVHSKPYLCCKKYEQKFGIKLPKWVYYEIAFEAENRRASLRGPKSEDMAESILAELEEEK